MAAQNDSQSFTCVMLDTAFGADGLEKAMQYMNSSAEQGNEYARNLLENTEQFENEVLANTVFSLFVNLSHCIEDDS